MRECNLLEDVAVFVSRELTFQPDERPEAVLGDTTADVQSKDTLWSQGETRKLLEKFTNYIPEVGPIKKFKDTKTTWTAIAAELRLETGIERTPLQCENRLKTVKKRYNNARKHNRQSGVSPIEVPYADEMGKLAAVDYTVFPEVMRGVGRVERNPPHMSQVSTSQANGSAADHGSGAAQEGDVAASPSKRQKTARERSVDDSQGQRGGKGAKAPRKVGPHQAAVFEKIMC
ncbi:hypothetical protein MTO96_036540 [Rhipicephalus appendiculatus]